MKSPEILKAAQHLRTNWSGGSSTELFIYPPLSTFKARDFIFRLSTATVEVERSEFTALPGFDRLLMVLEGGLKLTHEGQHTIVLAKFDADRFKGEWNTVSEGKCVDFNLIYKSPLAANIQGIQLLKGDCLRENIVCKVFLFVYCYSGSLIVLCKQKIHMLNAGDLWWTEGVVDEIISFEGVEKTNFVQLKIEGN